MVVKHNLAILLRDTDRHEEAEELCRDVLKGRVELYSEEHEDTLMAKHCRSKWHNAPALICTGEVRKSIARGIER